MTIFHSVGRGRVVGGKISDGKKRNTRKAYGRGGMRGGKNSNVHSAVRVVYVHSFVFFYSHLLCPTLTQATREVSFKVLLLGFSCQPLKRNLPFGHCHFCTIRSYAQASSSSTYHRVFFFSSARKGFPIFYSLGNAIRLWMNIRSIVRRMQRREKELEIRLPIIPTRSSKLWKNNFSQIPPSIQLSNILRSFPRDP